ncbi:MAG: hypothetical protein HQL91_06820 [Magnetococcales bacterium]|nr:hypothetical protein [Magnetococcales bacterium]
MVRAHAEAYVRVLFKALQPFEAARDQDHPITRNDLASTLVSTKTSLLAWMAGMFTAQAVLIIGAMFFFLETPPAQPVYQAPAVQEMRLPTAPTAPAPTAPPAR